MLPEVTENAPILSFDPVGKSDEAIFTEICVNHNHGLLFLTWLQANCEWANEHASLVERIFNVVLRENRGRVDQLIAQTAPLIQAPLSRMIDEVPGLSDAMQLVVLFDAAVEDSRPLMLFHLIEKCRRLEVPYLHRLIFLLYTSRSSKSQLKPVLMILPENERFKALKKLLPAAIMNNDDRTIINYLSVIPNYITDILSEDHPGTGHYLIKAAEGGKEGALRALLESLPGSLRTTFIIEQELLGSAISCLNWDIVRVLFEFVVEDHERIDLVTREIKNGEPALDIAGRIKGGGELLDILLQMIPPQQVVKVLTGPEPSLSWFARFNLGFCPETLISALGQQGYKDLLDDKVLKIGIALNYCGKDRLNLFFTFFADWCNVHARDKMEVILHYLNRDERIIVFAQFQAIKTLDRTGTTGSTGITGTISSTGAIERTGSTGITGAICPTGLSQDDEPDQRACEESHMALRLRDYALCSGKEDSLQEKWKDELTLQEYAYLSYLVIRLEFYKTKLRFSEARRRFILKLNAKERQLINPQIVRLFNDDEIRKLLFELSYYHNGVMFDEIIALLPEGYKLSILTFLASDLLRHAVDWGAESIRKVKALIPEHCRQTKIVQTAHLAYKQGTVDSFSAMLEGCSEEAIMHVLSRADRGQNCIIHDAAKYNRWDIIRPVLQMLSENNRVTLLTFADNKNNTTLHHAIAFSEGTRTLSNVKEFISLFPTNRPFAKLELMHHESIHKQTPLQLAANYIECMTALLPFFGNDILHLFFRYPFSHTHNPLKILFVRLSQEEKEQFLGLLTRDEQLICYLLLYTNGYMEPMQDLVKNPLYRALNSILDNWSLDTLLPQWKKKFDPETFNHVASLAITLLSLPTMGPLRMAELSACSTQMIEKKSGTVGMLERIVLLTHAVFNGKKEWVKILLKDLSPKTRFELLKKSELIDCAFDLPNAEVIKEVFQGLTDRMCIALLTKKRQVNNRSPLISSAQNGYFDNGTASLQLVSIKNRHHLIDHLIEANTANPLFLDLGEKINSDLIEFFKQFPANALVRLFLQEHQGVSLLENALNSCTIEQMIMLFDCFGQGKMRLLMHRRKKLRLTPIQALSRPASILTHTTSIRDLFGSSSQLSFNHQEVLFQFFDDEERYLIGCNCSFDESRFKVLNITWNDKQFKDKFRRLSATLSPLVISSVFSELKKNPAHYQPMINLFIRYAYLEGHKNHLLFHLQKCVEPEAFEKGLTHAREKDGIAPPLFNFLYTPCLKGREPIRLTLAAPPQGHRVASDLNYLRKVFVDAPEKEKRELGRTEDEQNQPVTNEYLLAKFNLLCSNISSRTPIIGAPQKGAELDEYYEKLELMIYHISQLVQEMSPAVRDRYIVSFFLGFIMCGTRSFGELRQYYELGMTMAGKDFIADADVGKCINNRLQKEREALALAQCALVRGTLSHTANYVRRLVAQELVLDPTLTHQDNAFSRTRDEEAAEKVRILEEVKRTYTPEFILKIAYQELVSRYKGEKSDLVINWLFQHVPISEIEAEFPDGWSQEVLAGLDRYRAEVASSPRTGINVAKKIGEIYGMRLTNVDLQRLPIVVSTNHPRYIKMNEDVETWQINHTDIEVKRLLQEHYGLAGEDHATVEEIILGYKLQVRENVTRLIDELQKVGQENIPWDDEELDKLCWTYLQKHHGIIKGAADTFAVAVNTHKRTVYANAVFSEEEDRWIKEPIMLQLLEHIGEIARRNG